MSSDAASSDAVRLVTQAKEWASSYGKFSNGPEGAVLTVPLRIRAAWERNDADAFADVFTENGSMLAGDEQLTDREQIRSYMTEAFAGPLHGSRLSVQPLDIRLLAGEVGMAITQGGVIEQGAKELDPVAEARGVWVTTRQDDEWRLVSYQTSPLRG
jgi:uncharacterized protein (TIGR02246 family)